MKNIVNVAAFLLPLFLFCYWGILGYAVIGTLRSRRYTMQNLLLSPVIGFSTTLLCVFWLNRLGLPVKSFAIPLGLTLLLCSAVLIGKQKLLFPHRYYLPFAFIFLLALSLIGKPLLKFGFDWISYGNDDMANYALGAMRFLNDGFFAVPDINSLINKTDYSLLYWFTHVTGIIRPGSELCLAWVAGITKLNPLQVFMPLIISFHLILISSTGALIYTLQRKYYIALLACLVLSFSALTALGTYYQLIAQVIGLSLLIAILIFTCQHFSIHKKYYLVRQSILFAITISVLLLVYPELIPFILVAWLFYQVVSFFQRKYLNRNLLLTCLGTLLLCTIFLNTQLFAIIDFVYLQYTSAVREATLQIIVFPYFLLPSAFPYLLGFLHIGQIIKEPFMSLLVILSAAFYFLLILQSMKLSFKEAVIPAIVSFTMICISVPLFIKNQGFGLFKLAMFMQPFLIGVIVISLFAVTKNKTKRTALILIFVLLNFLTFHFYKKRSFAEFPGEYTEIAYGSQTKINQEYRQLIDNLPKDTWIISDDFNLSLIKFLALQSAPHPFIPLTTPSNFIMGVLDDHYHLMQKSFVKFFFAEKGRQLVQAYNRDSFYHSNFNLFDNHATKMDFVENKLCSSIEECNQHGVLLSDTALRSIFNRRDSIGESQSHNFNLQKMADVHNHLSFIDSSFGKIYHSVIASNRDYLSLFNLENDPTYPHNTMQSMGRYLLMRVINPDAKVRLEISLSNTFDADGLNAIPPASVVGHNRIELPLVGRGSARVFSTSFSPQMINGIPYIAIDMNVAGKKFPWLRRGIMNLYNKNIRLDSRSVATFVRDISLLSEADYQLLNPPHFLKDFPADLANPDLEYSGIYEDGWIAEHAYLYLKQAYNSNQLFIQGKIIKSNTGFYGNTLTVTLDGKRIVSKSMAAGDFIIRIPVKTNYNKQKIELMFNNTQPVSKNDKRPVAAKLYQIGFK